ncbi:MAG: hypothetical protein U0931_13640 [Vulcanimicrobiota bacterium]
MFIPSGYGVAPRPYFSPGPYSPPFPQNAPGYPQDHWVGGPAFPAADIYSPPPGWACPAPPPRFHPGVYPFQVWNYAPPMPPPVPMWLPFNTQPGGAWGINPATTPIPSPSAYPSQSYPITTSVPASSSAEAKPAHQVAEEAHAEFMRERSRIHEENMNRVDREGQAALNSNSNWRSMSNWWSAPVEESEEEKARNRDWSRL